jgi:hypothetical protein
MRDEKKVHDFESRKLVTLAGISGCPDELGRNPRYRKAAPMRLYALDRVETAGDGAVSAEAIGRVAKSRAAAAKAVATKKAALMSWSRG